MSHDPFEPLPAETNKTNTRKSKTWQPILPVPEDAPLLPVTHPTKGAPSATWEYRDQDGALLGLVCRFERPDGGKDILPLSWCRSSDGVNSRWRWKAPPAPRSLYGLQYWPERPCDPVLVTEGEKAADAARELLKGFLVVCSSGGSKAVRKTDWSPLQGRDVIIWPDADEAGEAYADLVAECALLEGAAKVSIIAPPKDKPFGWDAADALEDGWTSDDVRTLIELAKPISSGTRYEARWTSADSSVGEFRDADGAAEVSQGRKRIAQRDVLLDLLDDCELWHDDKNVGYATYAINGHQENQPIRSQSFRNWLSFRFYKNHGSAIGSQALEDALRVLEARAIHEGTEHKTWRRVAKTHNESYLDLGDEDWRAIEVGKDGWRVISNPPVKFLRSHSSGALPEPEKGHLIEEFRSFVPVAREDDFKLIVAWMVAALRGSGPYPILVINGEQGSGKSGLTRLIRMLIDPNSAAIHGAPRDERDLIISAENRYILAYDNLSGIPHWLSDNLCRIATGSGFTTRRLHTDRDEEVFAVARPFILNGIPNLTDRPDLADRSITIHLPAIPASERRSEDELKHDLDIAAPRILGALLDAVSAAMRHLPETKLDELPRMADFVKWATAAEPGLGWERGSFLKAYESNRRDTFNTALEADPLAIATRYLISQEHPDGWEGKPAELLDALNRFVPESTGKSRFWPKSASALGSKFRRAAPLLKSAGFIVEYGHSGERFIQILPPTP